MMSSKCSVRDALEDVAGVAGLVFEDVGRDVAAFDVLEEPDELASLLELESEVAGDVGPLPGRRLALLRFGWRERSRCAVATRATAPSAAPWHRPPCEKPTPRRSRAAAIPAHPHPPASSRKRREASTGADRSAYQCERERWTGAVDLD